MSQDSAPSLATPGWPCQKCGTKNSEYYDDWGTLRWYCSKCAPEGTPKASLDARGYAYCRNYSKNHDLSPSLGWLPKPTAQGWWDRRENLEWYKAHNRSNVDQETILHVVGDRVWCTPLDEGISWGSSFSDDPEYVPYKPDPCGGDAVSYYDWRPAIGPQCMNCRKDLPNEKLINFGFSIWDYFRCDNVEGQADCEVPL